MTEENSFESLSNNEDAGFDFSALEAEPIAPLGDFSTPDAKATRPGWRERVFGKKTETETPEPRVRKARPVPPMPRGGLKPALEQMYSGVGIMIMPFDPHCAKIVMDNASECAAALDELAKNNPEVRRVLISLVTTSAWGKVIIAHAPIVMAVAMHHIPALRERQEKMVGEFAEMMANGFPTAEGESEE